MISGNLLVTYKQDGSGKWVMEKVESKDVEGKTISHNEAMTKFAQSAKPICSNCNDMLKYRK